MTALLTPAQEKLRDEAREFTAAELLPVANELDPQHADIPGRSSSGWRSSAGSAS